MTEDQTTTVPDSQTVKADPMETLQHVLGQILDRLPVANESDLLPIREEVASLYIDPNAESESVPDSSAQGATFPGIATADLARSDLGTWIANASQSDLDSLDEYVKANWPQTGAPETPA